MGFSVQKNGFTKLLGDGGDTVGNSLGFDLMTELAKAMDLVYPSTLQDDTPVAVFESAAMMDPLADSGQKWRLRIEVADAGATNRAEIGTQEMRVHAGTEYQIPSDGTEPTKEAEVQAYKSGSSVPKEKLTSGNLIGTPYPQISTNSNTDERPKDIPFLFTGSMYEDSDPASGPLTYRLSVSDHGIAFCAWKDAYDDAGDKFVWFVIQRPVDPNTGETLIDGYSPVFAVYSSGGGGPDSNGEIVPSGIQKFVVRESDVLAPTKSVPAAIASEDSSPIINPLRQVAISVDNKYMITFPAGLNTPKRAYKHELDMLAYTSADVISQDSDVDITVFGEETPRKYKAMNANGPFNTCMRILFLVEGGGIPAAPIV